jgi:hypothetical protein
MAKHPGFSAHTVYDNCKLSCIYKILVVEADLVVPEVPRSAGSLSVKRSEPEPPSRLERAPCPSTRAYAPDGLSRRSWSESKPPSHPGCGSRVPPQAWDPRGIPPQVEPPGRAERLLSRGRVAGWRAGVPICRCVRNEVSICCHTKSCFLSLRSQFIYIVGSLYKLTASA